MSRIVAGRFDVSLEADATIEDLKRAGFADSEIDSFYVAPPGQHSITPIGGDAISDAGSRGAGRSALFGALAGLALGLVIGLVLAQGGYGPPAVPLLALLGALVGAFAGAMTRLRGGQRREATREHPVEPRGGRMIAVLADKPDAERRAIDILRRHRARDLARAEGKWRDGSWSDFDPRAPLSAA